MLHCGCSFAAFSSGSRKFFFKKKCVPWREWIRKLEKNLSFWTKQSLMHGTCRAGVEKEKPCWLVRGSICSSRISPSCARGWALHHLQSPRCALFPLHFPGFQAIWFFFFRRGRKYFPSYAKKHRFCYSKIHWIWDPFQIEYHCSLFTSYRVSLDHKRFFKKYYSSNFFLFILLIPFHRIRFPKLSYYIF